MLAFLAFTVIVLIIPAIWLRLCIKPHEEDGQLEARTKLNRLE